MEGDRQIREMRSDFAFFFSCVCRMTHSLLTLLYREAAASLAPSALRNTTRKVRLCQIGDTLFGDCTRTLLSPSGVSEET